MALQSLRLKDYSDTELLALIQDVADNDGWSYSEDIAEKAGVNLKKHSNSCVGARLSWMKRWGWVEHHERKPAWRVTPIGEMLMQGKLSKSVKRALENMTPGEQVQMTRALAQRAGENGSPMVAMKREWRREVEFK